jgi:hypothetical protein
MKKARWQAPSPTAPLPGMRVNLHSSPFKGEVRRGMGELSVDVKHTLSPHPHPSLPLEGEGVCVCH